jgi:hypothetical protein
VLERSGCRILSEKKNPAKRRVAFLFCPDRRTPRSVIEHNLETQVDAAQRGSVDWQID